MVTQGVQIAEDTPDDTPKFSDRKLKVNKNYEEDKFGSFLDELDL
jgi:hypothetical protein